MSFLSTSRALAQSRCTVRSDTPRSLAMSDGICASLQLINFLQDVEIDYRKDRIYLPQDEMLRYGVDESQIASGDAGGTWPEFMRQQCAQGVHGHCSLHM